MVVTGGGSVGKFQRSLFHPAQSGAFPGDMDMKKMVLSRAYIVSVLIASALVCTEALAEAQDSKTFIKPTVNGYRLDWCLRWGTQCGKPAADAWCGTKFGKAGGHAVAWKQAPNIGSFAPTYVIRDKKVCRQQFCDGFESITCVMDLEG